MSPLESIEDHARGEGGAGAPAPLASEGEWRRYPLDPADEGHTVVGNLMVLNRFHSPRLGNQRDLLVYLPPSYSEGDRRYPVIYMHDGQNLFDEATSFGEEWRVDDTMEALGQEGLEALVVGVPNAGEHRCDEYSPFEDAENGGGKGDLYLGFLTDTLKPLIDRDFRTLPGREHTVIAGSSMGGLISLYAFLRRPDVFGAAGVMSPSLWFADRAVLDFAEQTPVPRGVLYLDVGTLEGENTVADVRRLRDALLEGGYEEGRDLMYVEQEGAGHTEAAWRARFSHAVPFLLARPPRGSEPGSAAGPPQAP